MSKTKIDLHTSCEFIIVEKSQEDIIFKDSYLYCGRCGKMLGQMSIDIKFPFTTGEFARNVKNATFEVTHLGLTHGLCAMTLFSKTENFEFVTLENYNA